MDNWNTLCVQRAYNTPLQSGLGNQIRQYTTVFSTSINLLKQCVLPLPITDVKPQ